jgi:hypothetical protein
VKTPANGRAYEMLCTQPEVCMPDRYRFRPHSIKYNQFMEKKVEIMPRMRDLKKGKKVEFPIDKVCTVRNNVSLLNAQGYKNGHKWRSETNVPKGIVTVFRDS